MKISQEELSKKIQEYIDDSYAYGDNEDMTVLENALKSISMVNEMEKGMEVKRLSELAENATGESKNILKDFVLYLENA